MRRIISTTFMTLDGVYQAPGGPHEDESGGFRYGGWQATYGDADSGQVLDELMSRSFDLLLGRRTYDIFAAYWPTSTDETVGRPFNAATKYVASLSERRLDWGPSVLIRDVPAEVAALKASDGPELHVWGSGELIRTFLREGLIDQLNIWTYPVLIGSGKRLFADGVNPAGLRLVNGKVSPAGIVIATYEPAGELVTGTVGE